MASLPPVEQEIRVKITFDIPELDVMIAEWEELWPQHDTARWMLAIAEEAGEVVGAYNKWHGGYSPKTREDVLEEMSQLAACLFAAAACLETPPAGLLRRTCRFMAAKAGEVREIRRCYP